MSFSDFKYICQENENRIFIDYMEKEVYVSDELEEDALVIGFKDFQEVSDLIREQEQNDE